MIDEIGHAHFRCRATVDPFDPIDGERIDRAYDKLSDDNLDDEEFPLSFCSPDEQDQGRIDVEMMEARK